MNILFLTFGRFESIEAHSIYADLLRCFRNQGNEIYVISPQEKRKGRTTEFIHEKMAHILHVATGNVTGSNNLISKGLAQLSIEPLFINAIKKYFKDIKFELVIYSTPPITFCNAVDYVKSRDGAKSYLLLKDIFPQNAVDLGMMSEHGAKGLLYKYFRRKEKKLYALSDYIGCMSDANVRYILEHNPEIDAKKVEVCPNSVEVLDRSVDEETRKIIREKYDIPQDKKVFVYGGNLGRPQGVSFLIECLKVVSNIEDAYFLIIGGGSEFSKLEAFITEQKPTNVMLLERLPKEDYDSMVGACDIGMIFLDHRFTIPNFPSRLLAYMQAKLPVLACTDSNTDIGKVIVDGGFGWWCESDDTRQFTEMIKLIVGVDPKTLKMNGFQYLIKHYSVSTAYQIIMSHFENK